MSNENFQKVLDILETLKADVADSKRVLQQSLAAVEKELKMDVASAKQEATQDVAKVQALLQSVQQNVVNLGIEVATVKSDVATVKSDVANVQRDIVLVKRDVNEIQKYQGRLYELAMRAKLEKDFGSRFVEQFTVTGMRGLARLVTHAEDQGRR